ncbi:alpha/beta fold hydrolase [Bosea sp. BK604]|uniref:alpha/beta fold hydrolase n=1 Tax=Bosea sp. BK604 TaxID=2512180 RepID=UPI0010438B09|nr:alpha/beta fold hydrolase [Bosea sp. BK604]TCR70257.1 alpha-beta hydrolase superfamily lysophospholipase [Bosea sp. BK604]
MRQLVFALMLCLVQISAPSNARAQSDFYAPSGLDLRSGRPGTLLRIQPLPGAPDGASAYRIIYRSTRLDGRPIPVSGVVIVPATPAPAGGRSVVAWAHPTSGVEDQCAPSRANIFFNTVQGLGAMLARGYVVAATDYPGLGMPGPHPYLVGISEGRAVLDSVRAARALPGAQAGSNFAVWGHSQGGQAALFTGTLARQYAPELKLVGVAAAAPATELAPLLAADIDTSGGRNLTAMTLWSWSRVYNAPITAVVTPEAIPVVDELAGECIERIFDVFARLTPTSALERSFLKSESFATQEPWRSLLARNTPGLLPRGVPLFLAQGTADTLVRPQVTRDYATRQCRAGRAVELDWLPDVGHLFAARDSADAAVAWMADRFAGRPPPSNCVGR